MFDDIFNNFITEKYDDLIDAAHIFNLSLSKRSNLVHATYLSIMDRKTNDGLKKAIENDNIFLYFIVAMRNQLNSKYSLYQKEKLQTWDDQTIYLLDEEDDNSNWVLFQEVKFALHTLYGKNKIDHYEFSLFELYYDYEEMVDISSMSPDEVHEKRKMSLRKLSKITKINYVSIHYTITEVIKKIKKELGLTKN